MTLRRLARISDDERRRFLRNVTLGLTAMGAGLAGWPFAASLRPSAKAAALGAPVRVDIAGLGPGEQATVAWRGSPVWVLHRTPQMIESLRDARWRESLSDPDSRVATQQPAYAQNATRSIRPDYFVAVASCTHLGCVPLFRPDSSGAATGDNWSGDYYCPCHGSRFDLAGRVARNVPAPTNLVVPPHRYLGAQMLEIGVDRA